MDVQDKILIEKCPNCDGLVQVKIPILTGWISVKERLPEIPKNVPSYSAHFKVLVAWGPADGNVASMHYERDNVRGKEIERFKYNGRLSPWLITHWMPLPEPPKI